MSRYWFEKLRFVVLRRAYVHVRIDADCEERIISLDGTAEFKLWWIRTMRYRTLRSSVILSRTQGAVTSRGLIELLMVKMCAQGVFERRLMVSIHVDDGRRTDYGGFVLVLIENRF